MVRKEGFTAKEALVIITTLVSPCRMEKEVEQKTDYSTFVSLKCFFGLWKTQDPGLTYLT
jgi:hypothetical protein